MITDSEMAAFRSAVNELSTDINTSVVTWETVAIIKDDFGEEKTNNSSISLNCLIIYNFTRMWPINLPTDAGMMDKENVCLLFNYDYLNGLGYISNGMMKLNRGSDVFIVDGIEWSVYGDTPVSPIDGVASGIYVILQRNPK